MNTIVKKGYSALERVIAGRRMSVMCAVSWVATKECPLRESWCTIMVTVVTGQDIMKNVQIIETGVLYTLAGRDIRLNGLSELMMIVRLVLHLLELL